MATQSPPNKIQPPNEYHVDWLFYRIWERLNLHNKHFMGVIVGEEGSGKSYTAVKIAAEIDPTFNADRIIFDVADLLEELANGNHEPGYFYVLDEAGVQLGRRTWQDRGQVLANQALQLIRSHNLGLLFTLPRLSELDSQAQGRQQAFLELVDMVEGDHVRGKWKWMDPDRADDTGKIYKKFPRRRQDGKLKRITSVAFRPPPEDIIEEYEANKSAFQEEFYEKTIEKMREAGDEEDEVEPVSPKEAAEEIKASGDVDNFVSVHGGNGSQYIDWKLIKAEYGMSRHDSKTVRDLLKRDTDV